MRKPSHFAGIYLVNIINFYIAVRAPKRPAPMAIYIYIYIYNIYIFVIHIYIYIFIYLYIYLYILVFVCIIMFRARVPPTFSEAAVPSNDYVSCSKIVVFRNQVGPL